MSREDLHKAFHILCGRGPIITDWHYEPRVRRLDARLPNLAQLQDKTREFRIRRDLFDIFHYRNALARSIDVNLPCFGIDQPA
jgi:hypothetical protein